MQGKNFKKEKIIVSYDKIIVQTLKTILSKQKLLHAERVRVCACDGWNHGKAIAMLCCALY